MHPGRMIWEHHPLFFRAALEEQKHHHHHELSESIGEEDQKGEQDEPVYLQVREQFGRLLRKAFRKFLS